MSLVLMCVSLSSRRRGLSEPRVRVLKEKKQMASPRCSKVQRKRYKATWKKEFKLPWRKASLLKSSR
jgi:hypothetical protein